MANCTKCGKPLKEGMKFCTSCGAAVKVSAPAKPTAPAKPVTATKSATSASSAAPARTVAPDAATDEVITTLGWLGTLIVLVVPILGIVLFFVWAFGTGGNLNRRNYCRAALIMMAVALVLGIIAAVMFYTVFAGILSYM